MNPNETSRWLAVGQFWASMRPLFLMELTEVFPGDSFSGVYWTPENDREMLIYAWPIGDTYRYLWNVTTHHRRDIDPHQVYDPQVGDIYLLEAEDRLIFIGPETQGDVIQVCADWRFLLYSGGNNMTLFQPGPGRTAWDRLNEPKE